MKSPAQIDETQALEHCKAVDIEIAGKSFSEIVDILLREHTAITMKLIHEWQESENELMIAAFTELAEVEVAGNLDDLIIPPKTPQEPS